MIFQQLRGKIQVCILTLLLVLCSVVTLAQGECEDFDELEVGDFVVEQLGWPWFVPVQGVPGDPNDAPVSDDNAQSQPNSFVLNSAATEIMRRLDSVPIGEGTFLYSHYMYVPTGYSGYFNVQSDPEPYIGWVAEFFFDDGGTGYVIQEGNTTSFTYSHDTWFLVEIYFDLDNDFALVLLDDNLIVQFQNLITIGAIDYYGSEYGGEPGAYYDDVCFSESSLNLPPPENLVVEPLGTDAKLWWDAPGGGEKGSILCVDRDGSADLGYTDEWQYIQPALDALGVEYTYYEVTDLTTDGPDFATLEQYDIVFWFCGESWENKQTMSDNDEVNLASYLDGGGNLLLSAFDYFWDRYPDAGDFSIGQFPYDYLGVSSAIQDNWSIFSPETATAGGIEGSLGEGIIYNVTDIYSSGKDGLYIDNIIPIDKGLFEITNPLPFGIAAAQNNSGTFRTVYTSLPIASITEQYSREEVLESVFNWFSSGNIGLTGYNIYYQHNMGGFNLIDMTPLTNYMHEDVLISGLHEYYVTASYESGESLPSNTVSIVWDDVKELKENELNIYPNPTKDIVSIQSDEGLKSVVIYNVEGQAVVSKMANDSPFIIDLSDLNEGIYLFVVETEKGKKTRRVLVQ